MDKTDREKKVGTEPSQARVEAAAEDKRMFDGNYHCAYCGKVFRIAYQAEFIEHQENCVMKPKPDNVAAIERILLRDNPYFNYLERAAREILSLFPEPVLTRISDEELDLKWERIINSTEKGWLEAGVREIAEAQLAHDQKQIKGERGNDTE